MKTRWLLALTVCAMGGSALGATARAAAATEVLPEGVPWRVFLTCVHLHKRTGEVEGYTAAPPPGWYGPDFDDSRWGRYASELDEAIGGYGFHQSPYAQVLCLRSRFGIDDPGKAGDLELSMEYRGGVVVYVNGTEIARRHLPEGDIEVGTLAEAYPKEAFVDPSGNHLHRTGRPADEFKERYEKRMRKLSVKVPAAVLREGDNVLAVEVHAAPRKGMNVRGKHKWSTAGVCRATLTSPSGRGVVAYADALDDVTLWNATPMDTIANEPGDFKNGFLWWKLTITPAGLAHANPFDPLKPIRTLAPRGGTCSGQVVASGPEPFSGLKASIGPMRHTKGGATIPADHVHVRYAEQAAGDEFCNGLQPAPVDGAEVQPVWVLVDVPRDQTPGWYMADLSVSLEGRTWSVPVQVLVAPWTVPDSKNNETLVSMYQSPETVAEHYKVEPWSDEHFKLIEASLESMAKIGNDVLLVPVILDDYLHHETGLIRWVRRGNRYEPDYRLFERYLDLHIKVFGKPKVTTLLVWKHDFGCKTWFRGMNNEDIGPCMVTELDPKTGAMKPMKAPHFGKPGSEAFWKAMIEGVRERLKKRGCSDEYLLLGEVFDSRPLPYTVEFFKKIAPTVRWQGYAHWVREPKPVDGVFTAHGGIEVGFKIQPNGGGLPELSRHYPEELPQREYLVAQAERTRIHHDSSPLSYRAVMHKDRDGGGTLARIGLDFWTTRREDGRFRSRYGSPPKEGWLWRGHSPAVTAPGPHGAVRTTRGQMLLEGLQETEVMVQLMRAAQKAKPELAKHVEQTVALRKEAEFVGSALSQATISLDWFALAAHEYALAAGFAGEKPEDLWNKPPAGQAAGE